MPRYFFNVYDGLSSIDETGTELPNPDEARIMAIRLAGEILKNEATEISFGSAWRLQVTDEAGDRVFGIQVYLDDRGSNGR